MTQQLTRKERIKRQARGQEVDRVPTLGGWILGVKNLATLGGISEDEFLAEPEDGMVKAHLRLEVDGMVQPVIPRQIDEMRTGLVEEAQFIGIEPEAILEKANTYPDSEKEVLASFNYEAEERHYRDYFEGAMRKWGGIEPVPNFWEIGGHFALYSEFGYTAFWLACAMYPEAVGKIYWAKNLHSRERAKILLKLYREYDLVPLMFCGEDMCNNHGPMVSPAFLRKYYFPAVRMSIEPLVDAGIRLIHHCDGDVRPLIDDFVKLGYSGFQGFQYELGIDPYDLRRRRSNLGEEMLFFAGLSVSRTLPFGTIEDIRNEVDYFLDFTDGGKGLFLFTSNVSGVEVPPRNLVEAYRYVKEWDPAKPRKPRWKEWPGMGIKEGELGMAGS